MRAVIVGNGWRRSEFAGEVMERAWREYGGCEGAGEAVVVE